MATASKKSTPTKSSMPVKKPLRASPRAPAAPQRPSAAQTAKPVATPKPAELSKDVVAGKKPVAATAAERPAKARKPKLVRDSFTIPKAEYAVLDALKGRAGALASPAKKSELLRAGIKALAAMNDAAFKSALQAVPAIKTGRPSIF